MEPLGLGTLSRSICRVLCVHVQYPNLILRTTSTPVLHTEIPTESMFAINEHEKEQKSDEKDDDDIMAC